MGFWSKAPIIRNFTRATETAKRATTRRQKAESEFEKRRSATNSRIKAHGRLICMVERDTFGRFATIVERLGHSVDIEEIKDIDGVDFEIPDMEELRQSSIDAANLLSGVATGVSTGATAGVSAFFLVGTFGAASTGTSIGALSGAAATNATLAWLGGGSLAAGGGGVAAGTAALGGIVIAPVLVYTGWLTYSEGQKRLTQAREYEARINVEIEEMKAVQDYMFMIVKRVDELDSLIKRLDKRANEAMDRINLKTRTVGAFQRVLNYLAGGQKNPGGLMSRFFGWLSRSLNALSSKLINPSREKEIEGFQEAAILIGALSQLRKTPLFDERNKLSQESLDVQREVARLVS
jgi:hypothetical protein